MQAGDSGGVEIRGEEGPDGLQQHDAIERLETPEHPVSSRQLSEILFRTEDWNRMMSKRGRPSMNQALLLDLDKAVTARGGLPKTTERSRRTAATITHESQVVRNQFSAMAMDEILQEQQQDLKNGFEGLGGIDMDIAFEVVFFCADWRKKITFFLKCTEVALKSSRMIRLCRGKRMLQRTLKMPFCNG